MGELVKYHTTKNNVKINEVLIERETEHSVWINFSFGKRRCAKRTEYDNYFDTFEEAKAFLVNIAEKRLVRARLALNDAQGFHGNIKGLKIQHCGGLHND